VSDGPVPLDPPVPLDSPDEICVAHPASDCGPAAANTTWLGPTTNDGGWLTAVTLIVTWAAAELCVPSVR